MKFFEKKNNVIYDLECYKNIFLFGLLHIVSGKEKIFEISSRKDESEEMLKFLSNHTDFWVGFNNINYDYPLFHFYVNSVHKKRGSNTALKNNDLYFKSKSLINDNSRFKSINRFYELRPQLDLYKINHYDNKNRRTSLKYLEFTLGLDNIEELPYDPHTVLSDDQMENLVNYLRNDLNATKLVYDKCIPDIRLRESLLETFNLYCYNHSNSKIGEDLTLKFYLEEAGLEEEIVKKLRSHRTIIDFQEVIHPKIEFISKELKTFLNWFKSNSPSTTKGFFKEIPFENLKPIEGIYNIKKEKGCQKNLNVVHKDFQFDFGTGGIHGALKKFKFEQELYPNHVLLSCDVTSLYPSSIIEYELVPCHLDKKAFIKAYRDKLYIPRVSEKTKPEEERNLSIVDGFKLSLNSVFGKMNSEYSWLYDPLQFMKTTVNNQLFMVALCEKLMTIKGSRLVMVNTDGLEIMIPKDKIEKYHDICSRWEKWSKFNLEHTEYIKLYVRDVNNYTGQLVGGKIKDKGAYVYDLKSADMHKNHSNLFAPLAVNKLLYSTESLTLEDVIFDNIENNIKMFVNGTKIKRSDSLHFIKAEDTSRESASDFVVEELTKNNQVQRVSRYICVNDDCPNAGFLVKKLPPLGDKPHVWRTSSIESSSKVFLVNNFKNTDWDFIRKNINLTWYKESVEDLLLK